MFISNGMLRPNIREGEKNTINCILQPIIVLVKILPGPFLIHDLLPGL